MLLNEGDKNLIIVLLGASGQLGREWQRFLNQQYPESILLPYTSSQLDITHFEEVSYEIAERQPDIIINCAAYTQVDQAEEERDLARRVNTEAVAHLAMECMEHHIKLVHFSTDYVFRGRADDRQQHPEGYQEDYPADPVNWYGKTKWEGEEAIRNSGCKHLIIRTTWLCGAYGNNFVKTMLRLGQEKGRLQVVDDQWGSPSFTEEVVRNTVTLLQNELEGTYHLTSAGLTTWHGFAKAIFELSGMEVDLQAVSSEAFERKADRPNFSKLSTEKAEQVDGITIRPWKQGLEKLLNLIKNH